MVFFKRRGKPQGIIKFIEYIESSGSQYIDTNFKPDQGTGVHCSMRFTSLQTWRWLFGGRLAGGSNGVGLATPDVTSYVRGEYGSSIFNFSSVSTQNVLEVDFSGNTQTVNGQSYTYNYQAFESPANMVLFARNTNGAIAAYSSARLYFFQIYDNGVLVRDYLPALDPDGTACLYDSVNKEYVYNAGSGEFVAGPEL